MFPLTNKEPYIKSSGERTTLGDMFAQAGGDISELEQEVDALGSEIQALTNQLEGEAETRAALGAHNLLPLTVEVVKAANTGRGTWSGNAITIRGITYTLYTDDNGNITYIDADGTATDGSTYSELWLISNYSTNKYKDMILNGSPTGYGNNCGINVSYFQGTAWKAEQLSYNGANSTLSLDWPNILFAVVVKKLQTVSHAKFYPMIRLATDSDTTYQPYAMTNKELTGAVKIEPITLTGYSDTTVYGGGYRMGNICVISGTWINTTGLAANAAIFHANVPAAASTTQGGTLVKGSADAGAGIATYAIDTAGDVRQGITSQNIFAGSFFLVYKC